MKNNRKSGVTREGYTTWLKCVMIMKLSAFLLLVVGLLSSYAKTSAQNTRLNVIVEGGRVKDVVQQIEQQTELSFMYDNQVFDVNQPITIKADNQTVDDLMVNLLAGKELKYEMVNRYIVVSPIKDSKSAQQQKTITGTVTSSEGEILPGVTVAVKGTSVGTITDNDGNYSISVPNEGTALIFTFIGMVSQEITIGNSVVIDATLSYANIGLEEIVAIGYGSIKRGDITGAVAMMNTENLVERPLSRIDQALVGQMAGVHIKQTSGMPGKGFSIQVRGTGSITANNEPLYVIDGFPLEVSAQDQSGNFTSGNPLDNINPNDIESIQVLKDASATAIYGSRGSNGVVLITTKTGKSGKAKISFNVSSGWSEATRKLDMLSSEEWVDRAIEVINYNWVKSGTDRTASQTTDERLTIMNNKFDRNVMIDDRWLQPGHPGLTYFDWQDEMFRKGKVQNYQLSATGGNEYAKYYVSGDYLNQEGFMQGVDYTRFSARSNMEIKASDKVTVGVNLAPSYSISNDPGMEGKDNLMHLTVSCPPLSEDNVGVDFNTGSNPAYLWGSSRNSPIRAAEEIVGQTKIFRTLATIFAEYQIVNGLSFKTTFNLDNTDQSYKYYRPASVSGSTPLNRAASGSYSGFNRITYVNENTLSYVKTIDKLHNISAIAGISYSLNKFNNYKITASDGFATDFITTLNGANGINTGKTSTFTRETKNVLLSYFGRIMYNYNNRYLLSAVLRRDGSSRFGNATKWGLFPSASLGWRISEESFMHDFKAISNLKVRTSWGISGNEFSGVGDYDHIALLASSSYIFGGALAPGQVPANYPNPDLGWEQSQTFDVGFDFGVLDNRITGSFDYYTKRNTDLLLNVPVPSATGFSNALTNIGEVLNKGWEFELNSRNLTGSLKWNTSINLSHNENEVVKLGPDNARILGGAMDIQHNILTVGEPMYSIFVVKQDGILTGADMATLTDSDPNNNVALYGNQIEGDPKYIDYDGNGVISPDDRQIVGKPNPDLVWGITNTFAYKGFDLSILVQGQQGGSIYSLFGRAVDRTGMGWLDNSIGAWRDRWRSPEDPGAGLKGKAYSSFGRIKNTDWLYSSDYWRIRNITLGYNLGSIIQQSVISNARIYVTAENWFGKDKYTGGWNPEAVNTNGDDYGSAPLPRSIIFGINITF